MAPDPDPSTLGDKPESPFGEGLGRAIKVLRAMRDLSRKALAKAAGVSYSYLAEIEGGTKQPSPQVLEALARALDLSVSELVAQAERWAVEAGDFVHAPLTDDASLRRPTEIPDLLKELRVLLARMRPEDRERLLDLARRLAGK